MYRIVNILMIAIIVSCPVRCMMQGCGCYASVSSCCEIEKCNCNQTDNESDETPGLPQKCQCKCFCSGVIVADDFVMPDELSTRSVVQVIDTALLRADYRQRFASESTFHPPDKLPDEFSSNRGRQIRCLISSLVI